MKTVFCEGGLDEDKELCMSIGLQPIESALNSDVILFCGGADVSPQLYGEPASEETCANPSRDEMCISIFSSAINKPKLGICRGAQFLAVMLGGKLKQHIAGHVGNVVHKTAVDGKTFEVNSDHHQAIRVDSGRFSLEAISSDATGLHAEAIMADNVFAVQFHPEWCSCPLPAKMMFIEAARSIVK